MALSRYGSTLDPTAGSQFFTCRVELHWIPMKNLKIRPFAFFLFAIFAVCFTLLALATGTSITDVGSALKLAYKTIPIVILMWVGFASFAWRWKIFKDWLV